MCVILTAAYILGNIYSQEYTATSLKKCSDLDKLIRKILVKKQLKGGIITRVSTYIPSRKGGSGLKSIKFEVKLLMMKKRASSIRTRR